MQRSCSHKSPSNQEQLEAVKEEVKNVEVVIATLNDLPGSWLSIHATLEKIWGLKWAL